MSDKNSQKRPTKKCNTSPADKHKVARAVRKAMEMLNDPRYARPMDERFPARPLPIPAPDKKRVFDSQKVLGPMIGELEQVLDELRKLSEERDKEESARWQAH